MSKQTAAAYAAGIMDGEGSFSIGRSFSRRKDQRNNKVKTIWYRLQLQISNTNKEVLEWFKKTYGGQVFQTKPTVTGKPVYHWNLGVANKNTEKFLLAILPYLIIKPQQARIALDFCRLDECSGSEEKKLLRDKMLTLNSYFWKTPLPLSPETNTSNASLEREVKIESDLHGDMQSTSLVTTKV